MQGGSERARAKRGASELVGGAAETAAAGEGARRGQAHCRLNTVEAVRLYSGIPAAAPLLPPCCAACVAGSGSRTVARTAGQTSQLNQTPHELSNASCACPSRC
eukprot:2129554-Rhodomonas_salina.3